MPEQPSNDITTLSRKMQALLALARPTLTRRLAGFRGGTPIAIIVETPRVSTDPPDAFRVSTLLSSLDKTLETMRTHPNTTADGRPISPRVRDLQAQLLAVLETPTREDHLRVWITTAGADSAMIAFDAALPLVRAMSSGGSA